MNQESDGPEVQPLREITQPDMCCGKRMRKFSGISADGKFRMTTLSCDRCGTQKKEQGERI